MYLRHLCSAWHYITPRQGICQGIFGIFFAKRENTAQYQKVAQKEVSFFVHFAGMVPAADSAALPPGKNACEASHIFTRSVAHLYTLCVYRAAPRRPVFYSAFSKAGEMFPKRNGFILFASTKRTKSSPEGCDPLDSGDGSKLYGKIFFVTFLTFVPKPVYGATHFFGCFEPVRKGCCSADARPLFSENGML